MNADMLLQHFDRISDAPETVSCFIELLEAKTAFLLSPIVVAEIYAGAFQREHKEIETLFSLCKRISIVNRGRCVFD